MESRDYNPHSAVQMNLQESRQERAREFASM